MRRRILAVGLALCIVLSGCAGLGDSGVEPMSGDAADAPEGQSLAGGPDGGDAAQGPQDVEAAETGDGDGESVQPSDLSQRDRAVIREGTVSLEVENFSTARDSIERAVAAQGGYVSDSSVQRHGVENVTWHTGRVVLRVPAGNFSTLLATVESQGTVEQVDVGTTDVTDQLVDIDARLENLERERDRLRAFMDRANDTDDLITIDERLSEVQGEIERLEAQRRQLLDRVDYSTLRVQLAEPRPEPEEDPEEGMPPLGEVFMNSVDDVLTAGQWLLVTTVALIPWAVALGVPFGIAAVTVRWRRPSVWPGRSSEADAASEEGPASSSSTEDDS